jgi:hypothetical protein
VRKIIFFLILLSLCLGSFVFAVEKYTYTKDNVKFSLDVPDGWKADNSGKKRAPLVLIGPKDMDFEITMNVMIEKTNAANLQEYVTKSMVLAWFVIDDKNLEILKKTLSPEKIKFLETLKNTEPSKEELLSALIKSGISKGELTSTLKKSDMRFTDNEIETILKEANPHQLHAVKEMKILSDQDITINSLEAYQAVIDYEFDFQGNTMSTRTLQTIILNKGYAYTITGSARKENFDKFKDIFSKVAASFKVE